MGISFGGGLSVVAASRLGDRAAWVLSFGGHGDLPRALRYLCTGVLPDGQTRPPHDYGVVIILLGVADRLVPADQVEPLRQGDLGVPERLPPRHGRQATGGAGIRPRPQAVRELARAGANVHVVGQQPRRRPSRAGASAARRGARGRPRALGSPQSTAVGTGLPAARGRRQRDSRGRIRAAGATISAPVADT